MRAVRGAMGTMTVLPPLRRTRQRVVSSFEADIGDVGAEGFGHTESVQGEEACQGVIAITGQSGLDQEGAELVSVQAENGRLMTQSRASDVGCRVVGEEFFFDAVPVETSNR